MARSRPPPRRTRSRWWRPRKNPAAGLTGFRASWDHIKSLRRRYFAAWAGEGRCAYRKYGQAFRRTHDAKDRGPSGWAAAGARGVATLDRMSYTLYVRLLADRRPAAQRSRFNMAPTRSRIAAGAVAGLMLLTVAGAAAPPKPAAASSQSQVFQFALQNGMQVLVIPDHRAPVVTQMLWFKVGAVDDPPGISGLAHFFEHMMFRGTKQTPGDAYSQIIAKNGGNENAFTTHDFTAFYEQIAADRLPLAMDLEADRIANLDLSDNNVSTERDVVLEERRMRVDNNPQALMGEQIAAALHLSHPYGRPVIGWSEEVRRIDRVSAQDFYDHHYAPNNATLIVAGDVAPDQVRALAQSEYGKVAAREIPPRAEFSEPPRIAETRMTVQRPDARVPIFTRTYRVPSYAQAAPGQAEGLELLSQIMGGDQTGALYRILVEQKKLASDAGSNFDGFTRDAAEFTVYGVP